MFLLRVVLLVAVTRLLSAALVCEETGFSLEADPTLESFRFSECPLQKNYPSFLLHTRTEKEGKQISFTQIPENYIESGPVYFVVHGWQSSSGTDWVGQMKDTFLEKENVNVITVNWSLIAAYLDYIASASSTPYVGSHISKLVQKIRTDKGNETYVWCIGHSLGAHVCHYASYKLTPVFNRISGLDPAGVMFEVLDRKTSLNPTSALFVDVIHTNDMFGTTRPLGHVDFYPNGGKKQAGCFFPTSSHQMAYIFFINSIKSNCYAQTMKCLGNTTKQNYNFENSCSPCKDCLSMGYNCIKPATEEIYFLKTSRRQPYCSIVIVE